MHRKGAITMKNVIALSLNNWWWHDSVSTGRR